VDVRVVAATARDLEADVADGRFREDLYYRLNVVAIRLPPLVERPEDVPPLIRNLLARHCARLGRAVPEIEPDALRTLLDYPWPGNVRELANALERALVIARSGTIRRADLPPAVLGTGTRRPAARPPVVSELTLRTREGQVQSEVIREALRHSAGNRREAAALLGISVRTLFYKLKELGISDG
jgi:DNA-binding NtrC family response regulator